MDFDPNFLRLTALSGLVLLLGGLSFVAELGLTRILLVSAVRAVVQLGLLAVVFESLFSVEQIWLTVLLLVAMAFYAARVAVNRSKIEYSLAYFPTFAGLLTALGGVGLVSFPWDDSWQRMEWVLPFFGLILGNSLTGVSMGMGSFLKSMRERMNWIETQRCLGATREEVLRVPTREAMELGLSPILNAMMVVGLVSFPGAMTGQLLAGASAWKAGLIQAVILFAIVSSVWISLATTLFLLGRRVFPNEGQGLTRREEWFHVS